MPIIMYVFFASLLTLYNMILALSETFDTLFYMGWYSLVLRLLINLGTLYLKCVSYLPLQRKYSSLIPKATNSLSISWLKSFSTECKSSLNKDKWGFPFFTTLPTEATNLSIKTHIYIYVCIVQSQLTLNSW